MKCCINLHNDGKVHCYNIREKVLKDLKDKIQCSNVDVNRVFYQAWQGP